MLELENQDFDKYSELAAEGKEYSAGNHSVKLWQGVKPRLPQFPSCIPFLAALSIINNFLSAP
jgi:hypothetical protein